MQHFHLPATSISILRDSLQEQVTTPLNTLLAELTTPATKAQLRLVGTCSRIVSRILHAKIMLSPEHRAHCCTTLLQLCVHPHIPLSTASQLAAVASSMMVGAKRINPKTNAPFFPKSFAVDWQPLYERFCQIHVERHTRGTPILDPRVDQHRQIMLGLVRRARVFFHPTAATAILRLVEGASIGVQLPTHPTNAPGQDLLRWSILATFLPLETNAHTTVTAEVLRSWTGVFWSRTPRAHAHWSPTCFDFLRRIAKAHARLPAETPGLKALHQVWNDTLPAVFDRLQEMISAHVDTNAYRQTKKLKTIIQNPTTPKSSMAFLAYVQLDVAVLKACKLIGHVWDMSFQQAGAQEETLVTDAVVALFAKLAPAYHPSSNNSDFQKLAQALKAMCVNVLERQCARASVGVSVGSGSTARSVAVARVAKATIALALRLTYSRDLRVRSLWNKRRRLFFYVLPVLIFYNFLFS